MTIISKKNGGKGWLWGGGGGGGRGQQMSLYYFKHSSNSINNFCKYMYMFVCILKKEK